MTVLIRKLALVGLTLWLLTIGGSASLRQGSFIGQTATVSAIEAPMTEPAPAAITLREQAELLCQTAGAQVEPYARVIAQSASRHNRLLGVSDRELADALMAVLVTENSGGVLWRMPGMLDTIYPVWDGLQVASNSFGLDYSVGLGRIRPQTAMELRQGWIEHQERIVYHNVRVTLPGDSRGVTSVSPQRLAEDEVSIEYLAANFEMGTAVAHAFGVEPTLLDLARWHNSGMGFWGWSRVARDEDLWDKGSRYLTRVVEANRILGSINGLAGCLEFGRPPLSRTSRSKGIFTTQRVDEAGGVQLALA